MKAHVLPEPQLEFRAGNRHIDPRFGLIEFGPADADAPSAPGKITIGMVGASSDVEQARAWLEHCREPIDAKAAKPGQQNMYPQFPGFAMDTSFGAELVFDEALVRVVADRHLQRFAGADSAGVARDAATLYADHARSLDETGRCNVILCARPEGLEDPSPSDGAGETGPTHRPADNFHDLLKAATLSLGRPIQILRRETWSGKAVRGSGRSLQDEATRAWNLHTALYYKAGGSPWRMPRQFTDLATCYVGISFFRALCGEEMHTAVAQVFNERGDGVVVRGQTAHVSKADKQPHLSAADAEATLGDAVTEFRRVHGHQPARVVVHKSSAFDADEIDGFGRALDTADIDQAEMISVQHKAGPKLFRTGQLPPLRGTVLEMTSSCAVVYTRGSVELFRTYPGLYVPQPLLLRTDALGTDPLTAAKDVLALSKMNWNNAQLDERDPLTLRTARNVGDILRHLPAGAAAATRYAFYM